MSNSFNPDDYKFNDGSEVQDSTSDSDVEKAVVSRTMKARGKVRTFKDDMYYSSMAESASSASSASSMSSASSGLASDVTRAAQEASAINAMRSSKITVGNREYTPGMGSKGVGGLNGSDGVFQGQNAVQQNSSMARAKAARAFGAMSSAASKAKDSVERNASKIKSYGDKFSFEDDGQEGAKEALNNSKRKAGDIGGSVSDGVSKTAAAISSARDRARQAKQAQLDKQLAAAQAQAQAQAKLNQDSRFTDKSDKFSDGFSKFSSKDRFDDKNGRFTAETDDRGLYKAKPDKADIEKAVTTKNIDKFNADKASGYDIAKGGKDNDFERKKNKYADRFIDPEQKKLDAQKANQLALNNDAKSAEITKQQKRDALAVNKKKFDKRSKKNRGVAVGSLVSKGKLKAPSKSLLKKQSKMRVIKAIGSGALLIGDDGKLEQGVRQGSGTGVGGKVRNVLKRVGDAIKLTIKALMKIIGFMIRHPVISLVLILIVFIFIALFTAINGVTVNWGLSEGQRLAIEKYEKEKAKKEHLPVMTIRGPLVKQIWGGAKSIDFSDEAAAALIGDAATQSSSVYDKNGNFLRHYTYGDIVDYANGENLAFAADYDDGTKIGLWGFRYDTGDAQSLREYAKAHDKEWTDVAVQLSYYYETDPQTAGGWLKYANSMDTVIFVLNKDHHSNENPYDYGGHTNERNWALTNAEIWYDVYKGETFVGEDIVNFALQYVGNAYCIGGDNLNGHIPGEDGIDCSHFVYRVLQETGHYNGGYITSKLWANAGTPVDSLSDLRPGDVAAYDGEPYGHVVIIVENLGGGRCEIVHAKGKNYGIVDEVVDDIYKIHGPGNFLGFSRFTY